MKSKTRKTSLCLVFFALVTTFTNCNEKSNEENSQVNQPEIIENISKDCETKSSVSATQSKSIELLDILWKSFRKRFPFHTQTIGCSELQQDSSCIILLSEPSPTVTISGIEKLLNCYSHKTYIKQHKIGFDGWVKDVVIVLAGIKPSDLEDIKSHLHSYMFTTNIGAYTIPLVADYLDNYTPSLGENLNYQIAPNELENWFCTSNGIEFDDGFLPDLLSAQKLDMTSLHYSKTRGFVAWIIPENFNVSRESIMIRRFSLDADLIIGAISKNNSIAIIGRERQATVFDLPPLRIETIQLLAAANKQELAQSYERNNLLACKFKNGKDWAPIYLSNELINTEYGSLLNITDQLLKSWSQNGQTDYDNFYYSDPKKWGFKKPLSKVIFEKFNTNSLTFNWNTSGSIYQVNNAAYSIVGLNRVGSLPVSYIPDEESSEDNEVYTKVEPYEQQGYNFFSNCNDANLIRAAQYAALYQIFKAYQINSDYETSTSFDTFEPLLYITKSLLAKIKNLSKEDIDRISLELIKRSIQSELGNRHKKSYINLITDFYLNSPEGLSKKMKYVLAFNNLQVSIDKLELNFIDKELVLKMLTNRNSMSTLVEISEQDYNLFQELNSAFQELQILKMNFDLVGIDPYDLVKQYVKHNETSPAQWIKTPSLVMSVNKDSVISYGGHNIDAKILKFDFDNTIKKGSIKINNGRVKINPQDEELLTPDLLRRLGVKVKNGELRGQNNLVELNFLGGPPKPPRNINKVFAQVDLPSDKRGFIPGIHDVLKVKQTNPNTYMIGNKTIRSCEELQECLFTHSKTHKEGVIEFIGFNEGSAEVRIQGLELKMKMETGVGNLKFNKVPSSKIIVLNDANNLGKVNRQTYVFSENPNFETKLTKQGKESISTVLKAKDNSHEIYVQAEAKSQNIFAKIKTAFIKAFNFSKTKDVDFIKSTYNELMNAGLKKNDFRLILSNSSDCIICTKQNNKKPINLCQVYLEQKSLSEILLVN